MGYSDRTTVTDKRGVTGTITTRVVEPNNVAVDVDGVTYLVPRSALSATDAGGYCVNFSFEGLPTVPMHPAHLMMAEAASNTMADIPPVTPAQGTYIEETIVEDAGPVQPDLSVLGTSPNQPVEIEDVSIERIPMDEIVETPPGVRQEGNVTIIPVVEEFLVVQKQLRVKEEIRVTKTKRTVAGTADVPGRGAHLA